MMHPNIWGDCVGQWLDNLDKQVSYISKDWMAHVLITVAKILKVFYSKRMDSTELHTY